MLLCCSHIEQNGFSHDVAQLIFRNKSYFCANFQINYNLVSIYPLPACANSEINSVPRLVACGSTLESSYFRGYH